jgi:hypothetical protein
VNQVLEHLRRSSRPSQLKLADLSVQVDYLRERHESLPQILKEVE